MTAPKPTIISSTIEGEEVVFEHGEAGLWFATSPTMKGLLVAKKTLVEAIAATPGAIRALKQAEQFRREYEALLYAAKH